MLIDGVTLKTCSLASLAGVLEPLAVMGWLPLLLAGTFNV
jgi:hypothetical protein